MPFTQAGSGGGGGGGVRNNLEISHPHSHFISPRGWAVPPPSLIITALRVHAFLSKK